MKHKILTGVGVFLCVAIFASSFVGAAQMTYPAEVTEPVVPVVLTAKAETGIVPELTDSPIVNVVKPSPPPEPDAQEVELMACASYQEAGGDACCDTCRHRVGDVILNRVADERFPDTILGVLTDEWQYGRFCQTGVVWPERSTNPGEAHAVERAYQTAREVLSGQHTDVYGTGYIFQAEFQQGSDVIYCENCGIYYGR